MLLLAFPPIVDIGERRAFSPHTLGFSLLAIKNSTHISMMVARRGNRYSGNLVTALLTKYSLGIRWEPNRHRCVGRSGTKYKEWAMNQWWDQTWYCQKSPTKEIEEKKWNYRNWAAQRCRFVTLIRSTCSSRRFQWSVQKHFSDLDRVRCELVQVIEHINQLIWSENIKDEE